MEEFISYSEIETSAASILDLPEGKDCSCSSVKGLWRKFCRKVFGSNQKGYFFELFSKNYAPFNFQFLCSLKTCFQFLGKPTEECDIFLNMLKIGINLLGTKLFDKPLQCFSKKILQLNFRDEKNAKTSMYAKRIVRFDLESFLLQHDLTSFFKLNTTRFGTDLDILNLKQYVVVSDMSGIRAKIYHILESNESNSFPDLLLKGLKKLTAIPKINPEKPFTLIKKMKHESGSPINMFAIPTKPKILPVRTDCPFVEHAKTKQTSQFNMCGNQISETTKPTTKSLADKVIKLQKNHKETHSDISGVEQQMLQEQQLHFKQQKPDTSIENNEFEINRNQDCVEKASPLESDSQAMFCDKTRHKIKD